MTWRKGWITAVVGSTVIALTACESNSGNNIIMVEDQPTTAIAATQAAPRTAVPTEPFVLPTLEPGIDPAMPITRVGTTIITVSDYQQAVRFERFARLYSLALTVEKHGPEAVLDLTNPENQLVESLFATLAESYSFGQQVHRIMIIDAITLQEATRRGIEIDPLQFDARRAQYLNLQVGEGGQLPAAFETEYARFLDALTRFTGMTEEDFLRIVRARVLYSQLKAAISQSPEANPLMDDVNNALSPAEIDAYREDYFLTWIEGLMDDPTLVEDYDNWVGYTPQEPLPKDVSPLLRDEYVTVPEREVPTATPGNAGNGS